MILREDGYGREWNNLYVRQGWQEEYDLCVVFRCPELSGGPLFVEHE